MGISSRHLSRELALQALYALDMGNLTTQEDVAEFLSDEGKASPSSLDYAKKLIDATRKNQESCDEKITGLARNWILERIATIDKIIMRMAISELDEAPDVPVKVVLNEAIELAKKFSTPESSGFVNGLLDTYVKQREDEQV